jgi:hypothetical protein
LVIKVRTETIIGALTGLLRIPKVSESYSLLIHTGDVEVAVLPKKVDNSNILQVG